MDKKIVFFDIDGTLITSPEKIMPESTKKALNLLHKNGILVFIATGRAYWYADFMNEYFDFDGYLCCNGQYCVDKNKNILFRSNISSKSVNEFINYATEQNELVEFVDEKNRYVLKDIKTRGWHPVTSITAEELRKKDILLINIFNDLNKDQKLQKRFFECQIVRWIDSFADVYPLDGGKNIGIKKILEIYNLDLKNTVAFGDGGNDVGMLKYVPNSIAMGNAKAFVKESATYVTDSIEKDGVYNALKRLKLI